MTGNVNRMLSQTCVGLILRDFDGMPCAPAAKLLARIHVEMTSNREKFLEFENPEWGSLADFLPWLEHWIELCEANLLGVVKVSW
ncbi:hypothetical protein E3O55_08425 [Cryobacterium sp. MDB1-18-2]|nr:hypothetical protein [Cryobacterium sp. MDB1-18-2]TFC30101.1 hypothetical protein E3O55_08425 [Cryobacterium sp. MDB1-18-2]